MAHAKIENKPVRIAITCMDPKQKDVRAEIEKMAEADGEYVLHMPIGGASVISQENTLKYVFGKDKGIGAVHLVEQEFHKECAADKAGFEIVRNAAVVNGERRIASNDEVSRTFAEPYVDCDCTSFQKFKESKRAKEKAKLHEILAEAGRTDVAIMGFEEMENAMVGSTRKGVVVTPPFFSQSRLEADSGLKSGEAYVVTAVLEEQRSDDGSFLYDTISVTPTIANVKVGVDKSQEQLRAFEVAPVVPLVLCHDCARTAEALHAFANRLDSKVPLKDGKGRVISTNGAPYMVPKYPFARSVSKKYANTSPSKVGSGFAIDQTAIGAALRKPAEKRKATAL